MTGDAGLVDDVVQTWKRFSRHAVGCEPCSWLAVRCRRTVSLPPYASFQGCCPAGQDLAERWLHARRVLVEHWLDLQKAS